MRSLFLDQAEARRQACETVSAEEPQPGSPLRRGVLLINLGTPERCDVASIREYLAEFLSDPAVIRLPTGLGWLNGVLGRFIARLRAPRSLEAYEKIWTERGSPLKTITEDQAACLEGALPRGWRVFHAMRYGRPAIAETLRRIEEAGIEDLVVVPMYPQFSEPTTGTAMRQVYGHLRREASRLHVTTRTSWHDDHGYINAQTKLIEQYARGNGLTPENAFLLFSTHGLPVSYVKRGDPYATHIARTVALVGQQLGWPTDRMSLAYQSRFGPVKWLEPSTDEALMELARAGERRVVVCPISFTTDCLETLEEIDVRYRARLKEAGAELYLCPALNTFRLFISTLKHLVLRGPRPMGCRGREIRSGGPCKPRPASEDPEIESLVLVGASIRGRLDAGRGPGMTYTDLDGLRRVKRSQCDVPPLLQGLCDQADLREAWLWNTCHRFELYGWLPEVDRAASDTIRSERRSHAVGRIMRHLLEGEEAPPEHVNVLYGVEAWHHLLRTAVGLGSSLPGETDVLAQLRAAHRLANRAGTAGPLTRRLAEDVSNLAHELRENTPWGQYSPDYCYAALRRIVEMGAIDVSSSSIAVIGGSTTSATTLHTLRERFDVPDRSLKLLYRGHKHGGHLKVLRRAIGNGRRVRVQSYDEPGVIRHLAEADVIVFGVDREEPVLGADRLRTCRDWIARPLTIFDFNMFGSTTGFDEFEGVTLYDARRLEAEAEAFADQMCASDDFTCAVEAAEEWIIERALPSGTDERIAAGNPEIGGQLASAAGIDRTAAFPGRRDAATRHSALMPAGGGDHP
jgi:ferrochelatase